MVSSGNAGADIVRSGGTATISRYHPCEASVDTRGAKRVTEGWLLLWHFRRGEGHGADLQM